MMYLQATSDLKKFIADSVKIFMHGISQGNRDFNQIYLSIEDKIKHQNVPEFNNEYILELLKTYPVATSIFMITDKATTTIQGKEITYFIFKGYHELVESGMVYYQIIDKDKLTPIGELQFSNQETNIFYEVKMPDFEESSCNAMETDDSGKDHKKIVFFVGNMNEERLLFDIERLIFTTLNNIQKHESLKFTFIINIARFGGEMSNSFTAQLEKIKELSKMVLKDHPNVNLLFEFAE